MSVFVYCTASLGVLLLLVTFPIRFFVFGRAELCAHVCSVLFAVVRRVRSLFCCALSLCAMLCLSLCARCCRASVRWFPWPRFAGVGFAFVALSLCFRSAQPSRTDCPLFRVIHVAGMFSSIHLLCRACIVFLSDIIATSAWVSFRLCCLVRTISISGSVSFSLFALCVRACACVCFLVRRACACLAVVSRAFVAYFFVVVRGFSSSS